MINQDLVTSEYDFEVLFSPSYLDGLFAAAIDAGDVTMNFAIPSPLGIFNFTIRPPANVNRSYTVNPGANFPPPSAGSFQVLAAADGNPITTGVVRDNLLLNININFDVQPPIGPPIINTPVNVQILAALVYDIVQMDGQASNVGTQVTNSRFNISVLNLTGPIITTATTLPSTLTLNDVINAVNNALPNSLPFLPTGNTSPIQRLNMRFFPGDGNNTPVAIGLYVNLFIRIPTDADNRPAFISYRGNIENAQNFLPMGSDFALAMSEDIIDNNSFGEHFKELIKEMQGKKGIDSRLKLRYVKVFPHSGRLRISINCRYDLKGIISVLDPSGTLHIDFEPVIDDLGLLRWEMHTDVTTKGLARFFGGEIEVMASIIIQIVFRYQYLHNPNFATLIDMLSLNIMVARKRWDPLFYSDLQLTSRVNDIQINRSGIAIDATGHTLERERRFITETRIRDKQRDLNFHLSGLSYAVPSLDNGGTDLTGIFPATERMEFGSITQDINGQDLVQLSLNQVRERIEIYALPSLLEMEIFRIHVRTEEFSDHTEKRIQTLLCATAEEVSSITQEVRGIEWRQRFDAIESSQGGTITIEVTNELGDDATDDEIENEVVSRIRTMVNLAINEYITSMVYRQDIQNRLRRIAQIDLSPHELGTLQSQEILRIRHFNLVNRQGTFYYRDDRRFRDTDWLSDEPPEDTLSDNLVNRDRLFEVIAGSPIDNDGFRLSLVGTPYALAESAIFRLMDEDDNLIEERSFAGQDHEQPHSFLTIVEEGQSFNICICREGEVDLIMPYQVII